MKSVKPVRWVLLAISTLGLLIASSARWVLAQSVQALQTPLRSAPRPVQSADWDSIGVSLREAFRIAVNEWISRARIQGGAVSGSTALLTPGSLVSDVNILGRMVQILAGWGVSNGAASAGSTVLSGAWNAWAANFQMRIPGAYPSFAAVPGPAAPLTQASVSPPLSAGNSVGEAALQSAQLAARLSEALRAEAANAAPGPPDPAMLRLATWVQASFEQWKSTVTLVGLLGRGGVPTYAPPYVPVGPVLTGNNSTSASPFVGPRFGIVVP